MLAEKLVLEFDGDGGLSGGGETSEPDCETLLVAEGGALRVGEAGGVVGDVAGLLVSWDGFGGEGKGMELRGEWWIESGQWDSRSHFC